jgi:DNA mismatch endonuclease, patch repair protein
MDICATRVERFKCSRNSNRNFLRLIQYKRLPSFVAPPVARSHNMRAIKSRGNNTTERRLRAYLIRSGISGWSLQILPELGSPDFVFFKHKVAVFVDGCFWHGCPRCGHIPKTNSNYWKQKIYRNRCRDRKIAGVARTKGFTVIRIWECRLKRHPETCLKRIDHALNKRK